MQPNERAPIIPIDLDVFRTALTAKRNMLLLPSHIERDPGRILHPGGAASLLLPGDRMVEVEACPPPVKGGLGNTGKSVRIAQAIPERGALLQVPVAAASLTGLNPATLRVFWWDERRGALRLVARSGLGADGLYVYAEVNRTGCYAVFGLPADRARLDTLMAWQHIRNWVGFEAAQGKGASDPIRKRLCNLILCAGLAPDVNVDPTMLDHFGLSDRVKGQFGRPIFEPGGTMGPFGPPGRPEDETGVLSPPVMPPLPGPSPRPPQNICDECFGLGDPPPGNVGSRPGPTPSDQLVKDPSNRCDAWVFEGPTNRGGRVRAFAWNTKDPKTVYMGNSQGGVFKSTNGGKTWVATFGTAEVRTNIGAIAIDPRAQNTVYAATGEYRVGAGGGWGPGIGVYRTTNAGMSWELLAPTRNTRHAKFQVDPIDSLTLYGAGDAGLERSTDGGATWTLVFNGACSDFVFDPTTKNRVFIAVEDATCIYVTADITASTPVWTPMATNLLPAAPSGYNTNYGRLAAGKDTAGKLVLWCKVVRAVPTPGVTPTPVDILLFQWDGTKWNQRLNAGKEDTANDYNNVLCLDPTNTNILYHGTRALFWSSDGGATFAGINAGHGDQHAIGFDPANPERVLLGNDGGVYELMRPSVPAAGAATANNLSAVDANAGNDTLQLRACSTSRFGALSVVGSSQDQGISRYTGQWAHQFIRGTENGPVHVFAADGKTIWWDPGGGPDYTMLSTRDGGQTARNAGSGLPTPTGNSLACIAIHPTNRKIGLGALGSILYRTTNGAGEPSENLISLPNAVLNGAGDFTVAMSIRTTNRPLTSNGGKRGDKNTGNYALISGASASAGDNALLLYRYASDTTKRQGPSGEVDELVLQTSLRGTSKDYKLTAPIEDGNWHHVCWVRSGTTEHLYLDGVALSTPAGASQSTVDSRALAIDSGALVLGQEQDKVAGGFDYAQAFQDRMRDVVCYRAALTAAQVAQLAGGTLPTGVTPEARYPLHFNGADASGNGHDATITGPRLASANNSSVNEGADFNAFTAVSTLPTGAAWRAVAFAPSSPDHVYAAASDGSIYSSSNAGAAWTKVGQVPRRSGGVASLAVDWMDSTRLFVGYAAGSGTDRVYRSDNSGADWHDVSGAVPEVRLPDVDVTGIVVDPYGSETLYVAMPIGPFVTRDGGATWQPFDQGLPNAYVTGMDLRLADGTLYLSTFGRGLWSRSL